MHLDEFILIAAFSMYNIEHNLHLIIVPVDESVRNLPANLEGATAMPVFCPAVVEGKHAVKKALADGLFPVVDKSIDVFAVPSAPGYLVTTLIL